MNRSMKSGQPGGKSGPVVTGSRAGRALPDENETELFEEDPETEEAAPDRKQSTRLLTRIQICVCAAVLIAAVTLRVSGGALYQSIREWYFAALGDSIVPDSQTANIKRTVVDLWSEISRSRAESSPAPSSQQGQGAAPQSGAASSGAAPQSSQSGAANNDNAASQPPQSGTAANDNQAQPNATSAPSGSPGSANAAGASSTP